MEDKLPLVTIRCAVYNHEPYLRQCLDGFVMQKTNFKFEAIVHDDASTDKSAEIIKEYADKYPDIIKPIFEKENQYSKKDGSLRRIMNEYTRGKYVAYCEGDDFWIDNMKLQKQVDFMEQHSDYSLCFHNAVVFYGDINKHPYFFCRFKDSKEIFLEDIISSWIIPTASILCRRELNHFPDWATKIYSGDYLLSLLAINAGRVFYINEIMSFYRITFNSCSSNSKLKDKSSYIKDQHVLLLQYFNEYTNFKYDAILSKRIDYDKKMSKYIAYKQKGLLYTFFRMPCFFIKKLYLKIKS